MNDRSERFTIGQLAQRTGLSVRTIRFWSDAGVVPPTDRSAAGYRLYDADAVVRLELVRTLRELGIDLDTVRKVAGRQATMADVAATQVRALDAEIRILQLRRAVLRSVARRGSTTEEMRLMHELARLSAEQRQHIIDEFVDRTFGGVDLDSPGGRIAAAMRRLPAQLPDDPAPEQVDAWVELAELVRDPTFGRRVRQMAVTGATGADADGAAGGGAEAAAPRYDPGPILQHAGGALAAGVAPDSAAGRQVLDRIVAADLPAAERARLADRLDTFTDRQVERYWQLLGIINGRPPFPAQVPAFEWVIAALRASA